MSTSQGKSSTSQGKSPSSRGKSPSSQGKSPSSQGQSSTSQGQSSTSQGQSSTSQGQSSTSQGQSSTSQGKSPSSQGKPSSSQGKSSKVLPLPAKQQLGHALWLLDKELCRTGSHLSDGKIKVVALGEYEFCGYEKGGAGAEPTRLNYVYEKKDQHNDDIKSRLRLAINEIARREKWNDSWAFYSTPDPLQTRRIMDPSFQENSIWFSGQAIEVYFMLIGLRWATLLAPSKIAVLTDASEALVAEAVKLLSLYRIKKHRPMTTDEANWFYHAIWDGKKGQHAINLCGQHLCDHTLDLLEFGKDRVEAVMNLLRSSQPQSQPQSQPPRSGGLPHLTREQRLLAWGCR